MRPAPPPGFVQRDVDGATFLAREDVSDALIAAGLSRPERLRHRAHAEYAGRGRPFAIDVRDVGAVFVRPYLHGGLLGKVTNATHLSDGRFRGELEVLVAARTAELPVPEPLAVISRPRIFGTRIGWLLVREEPGAQDLMAFLSASPFAVERRRVLEAAGRAVRTLHDAGFEHPDLHLKNLLLLADGSVLVLDLDRSRRVPSLTNEERLTGLFRFDRYAAKQAARGAPVSRVDRLRFLRAYAGDDWPERAEVRALAGRLARHIALHASARKGTLGASL